MSLDEFWSDRGEDNERECDVCFGTGKIKVEIIGVNTTEASFGISKTDSKCPECDGKGTL